MRKKIDMRFSKRTKRTVVFAAIDAHAPIKTVYVDAEWLRSERVSTKQVFLTISDETVPEDAPEISIECSDDEGDAFDAFLSASVVQGGESRLTTERIWSAWATHCGEDPAADIIADVRKRDVAKRFRSHFSAPVATRGRVDGRVQYYWEGYAITSSQ